VAVEHQGVLSQCAEVDTRAQAASDQPGYLVCSSADPAADTLPLATSRGRPRQHGVLRRHPPLAGPPQPSGYALGHARGTEHPGPTELHQHGALGMHTPVAAQTHRPEPVRLAPIRSRHAPTLFASPRWADARVGDIQVFRSAVWCGTVRMSPEPWSDEGWTHETRSTPDGA